MPLGDLTERRLLSVVKQLPRVGVLKRMIEVLPSAESTIQFRSLAMATAPTVEERLERQMDEIMRELARQRKEDNWIEKITRTF